MMKTKLLSNIQIRKKVMKNWNIHGFTTQAVHDVIQLKDQNTKLKVERLKGKALGDSLKAFCFENKEMIVFYKKDFDEAFDLTEKYWETKKPKR